MKVKYIYKLIKPIEFKNVWPIEVGNFLVEWEPKDGKSERLSITTSTEDPNGWPTIRSTPDKKQKLDIVINEPSRQKVESFARVMVDILHLLSEIEIDFDNPVIEWIPENEDEKKRLGIFKISRGKQPLPERTRPFSYEYVVRAAFSSKELSKYEMAFSFLRRARHDLDKDHYIEAFYDLFFFVETLYAPGFSNPHQVSSKILSSTDFTSAFTKARARWATAELRKSKFDKLNVLSDIDLIKHLVFVRGELHHHASRKPGIWHPDKQADRREEALLLFYTAHEIAWNLAMPVVFSKENTQNLHNSINSHGPKSYIRTVLRGRRDGIDVVSPKIRVRVPSDKISRESIVAVDRELRDMDLFHNPSVFVTGYTLKTDDEDTILAQYTRYVENLEPDN